MSEPAKKIDDLVVEVQNFISTTNEEVEKHGSIGLKNQEAMAKLEDKLEAVNATIADLEQKNASLSRTAEKAKTKTLGETVTNSKEYEAYKNGSSEKMRLETQMNTIQTDTSSGTSLSSAEVAPQRLSGVYGGAFAPITALDALVIGQTGSNMIEFTQEATNSGIANASPIAEGQPKGQSSITFDLVQTPVQTIPTWLKVSKQAADDAPQLITYIDRRLTYMVNKSLENQVVNGNGTAPALDGILNNAPTQTFAEAKMINGLREMITTLQLLGYAPSAWMMNPADVQKIDVAEDTNGIYLVSDPRVFNLPVLWGVPIVASTAVAANTVVLGDFNMASALFMRQNTVVEMFEQDDTNVQSNLITIRAENRAAYATYAPAATVQGDTSALTN